MSIKGYTDASGVNTYLGTSAAPQPVPAAYLAAAEQVVDALSKTSWLDGQIVAEQYLLPNRGIRLYLRRAPVTSVDAITVRSFLPGDTGQVLTAGTDYELIDPTGGLVALSGVYSSAAYYSTYGNYGGSEIYNESGTILNQGQFTGQVALVTYTPVQVVPPAVSLATAQLVAFWLVNQIDPGRYGLSGMRTADESVQVEAAFAQGVIPPGITDLLGRSVGRLHL